MSNAIFCGYPDTVTGMMSSGHVVLALGTLMYGGKMEKENDAAVSMLKRWPSLLQALYGPSNRTVKDVQENKTSFQTYKRDVDLFELLSDTSPFELSIVRSIGISKRTQKMRSTQMNHTRMNTLKHNR